MGVSAHGYNNGVEKSQMPQARVRIVHAEALDGSGGGVSDWEEPTGTSGDWVADADPLEGTADFYEGEPYNINCNYSNSPKCDGAWFAYVYWDERDGAPSCNSLAPMEICLYNSYRFETFRRGNGATDCVAGSGRFRLVTYRHGDFDRDGDSHINLLPLQQSGSGVMTSGAWVTSIDVVNDEGLELMVIKANQDFQIADDDSLIDGSTMAIVLGGQQSFSPGIIGGNPPFFAEQVPANTQANLQVDMSWVCDMAGVEAISQPQGYVLDLNDVGCGVPQKITMRPLSDRIVWEIYGNPAYDKETPTISTPAGERFLFAYDMLVVRGTLIEATSVDATLMLDEILWDDAAICSTGIYTLPVE